MMGDMQFICGCQEQLNEMDGVEYLSVCRELVLCSHISNESRCWRILFCSVIAVASIRGQSFQHLMEVNLLRTMTS